VLKRTLATLMVTGGLVLLGAAPPAQAATCTASTDTPAVRGDGATIDAAFSYRCPVTPKSVTLKGTLYAQDASTKGSSWITVRPAPGYTNPTTKTWYSEKASPAAMHATGQLKVGKWRYILVIQGSLVGPDGKKVDLNQYLIPGFDMMGTGWSKTKTVTFNG
jgi:hypothetical protein